jgi:hypothetical protein
LTRLLISSKDPSSQQKNNNEEREREGRDKDIESPRNLREEKKTQTTKKGQSDILGQKFGQTWKRHSCLG